jgi:hypothetical protein
MKPEKDTIQIKIEEDGTITTITGRMGVEIHQTAEEFLQGLAETLGAKVTVKELPHRQAHLHNAQHTHDHVHNRS